MANQALIKAALAARANAYAPYSKFLVGAALRDEKGEIHAGCNVENAAYPQGTCAEAGAIAALVLSGARRITEVVVVGAGGSVITPCGGCRQKLREFAGNDVAIHACNEKGDVLQSFTLGALLPNSFGPEHLGGTKK